MKYHKNLSTKPALVSIPILLVGIGFAIYTLKFYPSKSSTQSESPAALPSPKEGVPGKGANQNETNNNPDVSKPGSGSLTITNFSEDAANVYIRAITNDTTTGTCKLELSKSGQTTLSRSAKLIFITSYYSCEGFNISKSDIPTGGVWTANLKIDGSSAPVATATLSITK